MKRAFVRFLYGPFLAWAVISAAFLTFTDPAGAQQRPAAPQEAPALAYSPQAAAEREELFYVMAEMRRCMFRGSQAMFRGGVLERQTVTLFTIRTCSSKFAVFMREKARWGEQETAELVVATSDQEYDNALRLGLR